MANPERATERRGRQAEAARNDKLVLDAARAVFATDGFDAPVAAIAARAGVGIGSLYRRYRTKESLLQHLCVLAMEQTVEAATTALGDPDPWTGLAGYLRSCVQNHTGALSPVAGTIEVSAQMWETSRRSMRLADRLVARAHAAGVLRADVTPLDIALLIEQFSRPTAGLPSEEEHNVRDRLIAIAVDGLRAAHTEPLPGRPPSLNSYVGRWRTPIA